jgi:hypothetical protein
LFADWTEQIPQTKAELKALVEAGKLSDQQVQYLAEHTDELGLAFDEIAAQQQKLIEARKQALEDQKTAINDEYQVRVKAINDSYNQQVDAIRRSADAQKEGYKNQLDIANEYISNLNSLISSAKGAISSFNDTRSDVINLEFERYRKQLSNLANQRSPDPTQVADAIKNLQAAAGGKKFSSQYEESVANSRIRADLEKIQANAESQLAVQEKRAEALQASIDGVNNRLDSQLEALSASRDRQLEQAERWKDQQLAALDAQIAALDNQVTAINSVDANTADIVSVLTEDSNADPVTGTDFAVANNDLATLLQSILDTLVVSNTDDASRYSQFVAWSAKVYQSVRNTEDVENKWDKNGIPIAVDDTDGESILGLGGS